MIRRNKPCQNEINEGGSNTNENSAKIILRVETLSQVQENDKMEK